MLTNDDVTVIENLPFKPSEIVNYSAHLYKLKNDYEIIEFSPDKYINFRKLHAIGITKDELTEFCEDVLKFVGESRYFTMKSLRKDGFSHKLDELGFDDWFYTSILVESKSPLSYQKIGGTKVMLSGKFKVIMENFLEFIVFNQDSLSIDIYELSELLSTYYGLNISGWKLIDVARNSSMFYDIVSEKIYADYDVYYEEI